MKLKKISASCVVSILRAALHETFGGSAASIY